MKKELRRNESFGWEKVGGVRTGGPVVEMGGKKRKIARSGVDVGERCGCKKVKKIKRMVSGSLG